MEELVCAVLNNGVRIPAIGYSTSWESGKDDVALRSALNSGYRFLDTEASSGNEAEIGGVLQEYFHQYVPREEIFVSSKVMLAQTNQKDCETILTQRLKHWKLKHTDMVCVDLNASWQSNERQDQRLRKLLDAWKVMEGLVSRGWTRCIGLCNASTNDVEAVTTTSTIKPAVVQVKLEQLQTEPKLAQYCKRKNIHLVVHLQSDHFSNSHLPDNQRRSFKNKLTNQVVGRFFIENSASVVVHEKDPGKIKQSFKMLDFGVSQDDARFLASRRMVPSGL